MQQPPRQHTTFTIHEASLPAHQQVFLSLHFACSPTKQRQVRWYHLRNRLGYRPAYHPWLLSGLVLIFFFWLEWSQPLPVQTAAQTETPTAQPAVPLPMAKRFTQPSYP
ncbi:MAG: hypothetical protein KF832_09150 [Caldilineaceae bacterium]|nr:hypothetical protein [Caldilineaceae bacterium]